MRERISCTDIEHLADHEVLEVLLYLSKPRGDTNEIAHMLEKKFGTLENICMQSEDALMEIPGIGTHAAWFLSMLPHIFRYYEYSKREKPSTFKDTDEVGMFLTTLFFERPRESVVALLLTAKGRLLHKERLGHGTVTAANIHLRELARLAIQYNATQMILAHNHPSGSIIPSVDDITTTLSLKKSLLELEVQLVDHFVIAGKAFTSMAQNGLLR